MKILTKAAVLFAAVSTLHGGTPEPAPVEKPSEPWLEPLIDIRTRYEFADLDGTDNSNAWTFRERLGIKSKEWNGLSALVEGEFTQVAVDDYHAGAAGAYPFDPSLSPIFDPETQELNQAYAQYSGFDTTFRLGRQRIIYDNAAFIGNVGWRQNEQTYDGISVTNKSIGNLTLNYAYINQVNRIFGSDAHALLTPSSTNVQDIASDVHLFNVACTSIKSVTLGAYAYIMSFDGLGVWDNNTFGATATGDFHGVKLYGELAWQDKAAATADQDAFYAHVTATKSFKTEKINLGEFTLGIEHLEAGFKTPLATVHVFNGYSDVTDAARISGAHNGLSDTYISHTIPIFWDIKLINVLHAMGNDPFSGNYGWEYDRVLSRKFGENFTVLAKFAYFNSQGEDYTDNGVDDSLPGATRYSIELNYKF